MPLSQISTTVAASSTDENVLAGDLLEIAEEPMVYEFGLNQSATGLVVDVFVGSVAVASSLIPLIKTTTPTYPDDFNLQAGVLPGQRVKIRARNTTGGGLTLLTSVRATAVG